MTQPTDVGLLAGWDGWCSPCAGTRPLVLTEVGPRGLVAWLRGHGHEDRDLHLYCRVCGVHQVVPRDEADDPIVVVPDLSVSLQAVGLYSVVLARPLPVSAAVEAPVVASQVASPAVVGVPGPVLVTLPAPRGADLDQSFRTDSDTLLDLVSAGLDAVAS